MTKNKKLLIFKIMLIAVFAHFFGTGAVYPDIALQKPCLRIPLSCIKNNKPDIDRMNEKGKLRVPMAFGKSNEQESSRRPAELAAELSDQQYEIIMLEPSQYAEYAKIFRDIYEKEEKDTNEYGKSHPNERVMNRAIGIFESMADDLESAAKNLEDAHFLIFWVVKDNNGEIIGARDLYKEKRIEEIDRTAIMGEDAVRLKYRRKGVGILLRRTAFEWLMKNGHNLYVGLIADDNRESIKNLYMIAGEMGLHIEKVPKFINIGLESEHYYLVELIKKQHADNETIVDAIYEVEGKSVLPNRHRLDECL